MQQACVAAAVVSGGRTGIATMMTRMTSTPTSDASSTHSTSTYRQ